ncbi:MAG: hypothetical protein [Caudoviricetes sp.]|nr:MAG: hypothetical protein [Caudoviricetes sp.]
MACELLRREFSDSAGNEFLFTTRQLSASKALDLQVELINKLGNTVFPFIDNRYNFTDIVNFMAYADNKVVTELVKRVVCMSNKEGVEITNALFDTHFNGELMMLCKVFAFVLEANFQSFFKQGLEMNVQFKSAEEARLKAEELKLQKAALTSPENSPT